MPEGRVAEDAVARLCHNERHGHLALLINDSFKIRLAVENESVLIALAETVKQLAFGLHRKILRVFGKIDGLSLPFGIVADDLRPARTHTAEVVLKILPHLACVSASKIYLSFKSVGRKCQDAFRIFRIKKSGKHAVFCRSELARILIRRAPYAVTLKKRRLEFIRNSDPYNVFRICGKSQNFLAEGKILIYHFRYSPYNNIPRSILRRAYSPLL